MRGRQRKFEAGAASALEQTQALANRLMLDSEEAAELMARFKGHSAEDLASLLRSLRPENRFDTLFFEGVLQCIRPIAGPLRIGMAISVAGLFGVGSELAPLEQLPVIGDVFRNRFTSYALGLVAGAAFDEIAATTYRRVRNTRNRDLVVPLHRD